MVKTLSSNLKASKNALRPPKGFAWLFDMRRDASNVSNYAMAREDITFNGTLYTMKNMQVSPPHADNAGTLSDFKVTVGNADLVEASYVLLDKYFSQDIVIREVNLAYLSSGDDQVIFRGTIKKPDMDNQAVTFYCGVYDLRDIYMPYDKIYARRCGVAFKSDECQYNGIESDCDHLFGTCTDTMNNRTNFFGCPFMTIPRP